MISAGSQRRNWTTNCVIEQRRMLELSIDRQMRIKKLKEYRRIKEDYYRRNPDAIRYSTNGGLQRLGIGDIITE